MDQISADNLWRMGASELLAAFASGETTPVEATALSFERIGALDPQLNAMVALSPNARDEAVASAARWKQGAPKGLLDGVPIVVKDNLWVEGMPATFGSRLYQARRVERDELPIRKLREAGAIVIGKTNCPEFALEGYTANATFGVTRNPFDTRLTPGGSSGGSVSALAAGLVPLAIGTDGGGSLRRPAAYTGLFGLKPGVGTIPRDEALPQLLFDFEVVGAFARSVRDLRLAHGVMSESVSSERRDRMRRILYAPRLGAAPCDPLIIAACDAAAAQFAAMRHRVEERELPFDLSAFNDSWPIVGRVALSWLRQKEARFDQWASPKYVEWARLGDDIAARELYQFVDEVQNLRRAVTASFKTWDAILTPCCAAMPWLAEEPFPTRIDGKAVGPRGHAIYTAWVNAAHLPAIAIPADVNNGLPIGFQLVGPAGSEDMLIDLAASYEARALGSPRWPDICLRGPIGEGAKL